MAFLHPTVRWRAEQDQINMAEDRRKLKCLHYHQPNLQKMFFLQLPLAWRTCLCFPFTRLYFLFFFLMRQQNLPQWTHAASTKHATDTLKSFHLHWTELCWQAAGRLWSGLSGCASSVVREITIHVRTPKIALIYLSWVPGAMIQDTLCWNLYSKSRRATGSTWALWLPSASGMPGRAGTIPPQITPGIFLLFLPGCSSCSLIGSSRKPSAS